MPLGEQPCTEPLCLGDPFYLERDGVDGVHELVQPRFIRLGWGRSHRLEHRPSCSTAGADVGADPGAHDTGDEGNPTGGSEENEVMLAERAVKVGREQRFHRILQVASTGSATTTSADDGSVSTAPERPYLTLSTCRPPHADAHFAHQKASRFERGAGPGPRGRLVDLRLNRTPWRLRAGARLAHYVVERALGLREGFLGLVASGWDIGDFERKGVARRLPAEAILAEVAAGEISRQAMMWQWSSAEDYVWAVEAAVRQSQPEYRLPAIAHETFEGMRAELLDLRQRWNQLAPGETMALAFTTGRGR
jgi:hypothetical protein